MLPFSDKNINYFEDYDFKDTYEIQECKWVFLQHKLRENLRRIWHDIKKQILKINRLPKS